MPDPWDQLTPQWEPPDPLDLDDSGLPSYDDGMTPPSKPSTQQPSTVSPSPGQGPGSGRP